MNTYTLVYFSTTETTKRLKTPPPKGNLYSTIYEVPKPNIHRRMSESDTLPSLISGNMGNTNTALTLKNQTIKQIDDKEGRVR